MGNLRVTHIFFHECLTTALTKPTWVLMLDVAVGNK